MDLGPLYLQPVIGQHGRKFHLVKLRTMVVGAHDDYRALLAEGRDELGKIPRDPRITPLGKIMRTFWIDELPNLINLAQGDVGVIGIRPQTEESLETWPAQLRESYLHSLPGLIGIQYCIPSKSFEESLRTMEIYLEKKKQNPIATDRWYFSRFLKNLTLMRFSQ